MSDSSGVFIVLVLLGGGICVMVFYFGVMKWLVECGLFEWVMKVFMVLGGSLLVGFML